MFLYIVRHFFERHCRRITFDIILILCINHYRNSNVNIPRTDLNLTRRRTIERAEATGLGIFLTTVVMQQTNTEIHCDTIFKESDSAFQPNRIALTCQCCSATMVSLIPRCRIHILIFDVIGRFHTITNSRISHQILNVFNGEEVLMNSVLPVLNELLVHQLAFHVIILNKHQINRSRIRIVF